MERGNKQNMAAKQELLECITEYLDENLTETIYYSAIGNNKPERGEIVLAHCFANKEYCFDNQFGRVVQIRSKCGQFGSDMYFLRLPDGTLMTAENQSYRQVPKHFLDDVESNFTTDISYEKDGFEKGYSIGGDQLEIGFLVDGMNTKGTPNQHFAITITQ